MKIDINSIVFDESIYPRKSPSEYNIVRLAMAIEAGHTKIPPVVIEAGTHRLVDGMHRIKAYERRGITRIDAIEKVYASEAELFADAVRLNISHGQHLDNYCVKTAIIRLEKYGYQRAQISEIVRLPVERIEKLERGFASEAATGEPIALKGGLDHMRGERLTVEQQATNRHYSGGKSIFHVNQLISTLETDMWPRSDNFIRAMDRLIEVWRKISARAAA